MAGRHASKKSPAQLQREIDETLARGAQRPRNSHATKPRTKTITVTMDRPGWDWQLVTHRVLADVDEPCGVKQIDDVTFEIECDRIREVREALNAHPAVKSYEV